MKQENLHKTLILGGLFGFISPFVGIFLGLQVSTFFGNILAFPFIMVAYLSGEPFGNWGGIMLLFGLLVSMGTWASIFYFLGRIMTRRK